MTIHSVEAQQNRVTLKVLLVIGGGFHDYETQKTLITNGLESRANITVTVVHTVPPTPRTELTPMFDGYKGENWANGYDVVVHNICSAKSEASQFVERVTKAHKTGVGAVFLHCALFNYRDIETDEWWKLVGLSICRTHEKHHPIIAANNAPTHPVMKNFPMLWNTPNGEHYRTCKVWPNAKILSWGQASEKIIHPVIWTNRYGKARVFSTTIGHHNETVETSEYLDLITRGVLWAADKLDDKGEPKRGFGLSGNF